MNVNLMAFVLRHYFLNIKDGTYVTNFNEYYSIGTHWLALYVNSNYATYFDSFGVGYISEKTKTFIRNKNITTNT